MIRIRFFTLLQLLLNRKELELAFVPGETMRSLLERIQARIKTRFLHKLLQEQGNLKTGTIILVNGKNIHHLQKLDTPLSDGDEVALFPPGGGG
ncbi:MAG: MoaD/ThiS family protein [Candidatus Aminicenantes bacterium]|nr:MoaD/ThiS family protein [Candidatus Aminicenantes bacterium]